MEGELGTDNMVNGISKVVKEDDLIVFKRGAGIINWDDLQDAMVNGIIFSKGCVYFRVVRMNVVIEEGGDNKIAGRQIRNGKPVVRGGEWVI